MSLPGSLLSLATIALLVAPGLIYLSRKRHYRPVSRPFRDALDVLAFGLGFLLLALAIVGIARSAGLQQVSDPARLIGHGRDAYLAANLWRIFLTFLAVAVLSGAFAWVAATTIGRRRVQSKGHIGDADPWWLTFWEESERYGRRHVVVELASGRTVRGYLLWFTAEPGAAGERSLVLAPWSGDSKLEALDPRKALESSMDLIVDRYERILVPASQIQSLTMRFVPSASTRIVQTALDGDNHLDFEWSSSGEKVYRRSDGRRVATLRPAQGELILDVRSSRLPLIASTWVELPEWLENAHPHWWRRRVGMPCKDLVDEPASRLSNRAARLLQDVVSG